MSTELRRDLRIPEDVGSILRDLPEWFGIEAAIDHYIELARSLSTYTVLVDGEPVGVCLVQRHGPYAAEIALIAVRRRHHRRGIGRRLLDGVQADLADDGVEFLQVKTLGPSRPSTEYDATRHFYEGLGFRALEEFEADELWEGNPCLLMVKSLHG